MNPKKTMANCTTAEFLRQSNKIRHAVAEYLDFTKILDIRKNKPVFTDGMTDDEKKAAADQALKDQLEELQRQLLAGKISNSEYKAMSITAKARLNSGIADDDKDFGEFINSISSEDEAKTSKIANYINTVVEKAYEKGKADATKNKLGEMGNFKNGSNEGGNGKSEAEEIAERLAKSESKIKKEQSYFK